MNLQVFLEVLWSLEFFCTGRATEGFQGYVYAEVGGNVVSLLCLCSAELPVAVQLQVLLRLTANMVLTQVMV